ncbi:hypothetical protein [Moraxella nasicaprae]|uniref:Transposase n=1 Tax=Moraxella nasicaprae TaxID=2904122 RepID=A0ABY6F1S7_9GAMM|nr:hypothetical protein [Moraxella nasicaprae]UXZ04048.1 hypothetical protein LU297_05345 [Moraxella nasicaprae]
MPKYIIKALDDMPSAWLIKIIRAKKATHQSMRGLMFHMEQIIKTA